tara:strand:- start:48839 stop:50101 length:1263 start_codon:yes stop_codon:yes gene_type:complete
LKSTKFDNISVVGLGYIGLPTAAVFAAHGVRVTGVDVNQTTVDTINRGEVHIVEPDLGGAVSNAVAARRLRATVIPEPAQAFLIAVPTPFKGHDHEPDLSYIQSASSMIAPALRPGNLIILESTSPVGATERMAAWLAEARPDLTFPQTHGEASDIRIAHCPERVLPGKVMQELITNDRIIGGMTPLCSSEAEALYRVFVKGECLLTDTCTAEMAKLTENSFRDVNIAFANELSMICDTKGINVWELIKLANHHPRVNILQPGPGVGGHCIAVDPWFIVNSAPDQARLIRTAREVNDAKPHWVVEKTTAALGEFLIENPDKSIGDVTLACYGLAFKPDIDDLRESPALNIAIQLGTMPFKSVLAVEPNIAELPKAAAALTLSSLENARNADIHVLLVDHAPFKEVSKPNGFVVDSRGIWP